MKKAVYLIFCYLAVIFTFMAFVSCTPSENGGTEGTPPPDDDTKVVYSEGLEYSLSEDGSFYSVSGIGKCYDTDIIIPEQYNGLPVIEIAPYAFYNLRSLENVILPDSIEKIGENAFSGCYSINYNEFGNAYYLGTEENTYAALISAKSTDITSLEIADGTKIVAPYAFASCSLIESVVIPDSVEIIGSYTFKDCLKLKSITLGEGIKSVGFSAFINCKALEYTVYSGAKYIGSADNPHMLLVSATGRQIEECLIHKDAKIIFSFAFEYCGALESVKVPDGVIEIGSNAFGYCSSLKSVKLPNTVLNLPSHLFYECISLVSAELPTQIKSVSEYCFYGCEALESIGLTKGIESIKNHAFSGCEKLSAIAFPKDLKLIGENAFFGCKSLTKLEFEDGIVKISDYAFAECTGIEEIKLSEKLLEIGKYAFSNNTSLKSLDFPDKLEIIGEGAFVNCRLISDISMPESIREIGENAFYGWIGLRRVNITDISKWCKIKFLNAYANPLLSSGALYLNSILLTEIDIPDGVETISSYAFYGYERLTRVSLPRSITDIEERAFEKCCRIVEIVNLSSLKIKRGEESFGEIARNALSIINSIDQTAIFSDAEGFIFCQSTEGLYLVGYTGDKSKLELPSNFKGKTYTVSDYAFYKNEIITEVAISESVSAVGNYSFSECPSLTEVIFSDTVTKIDKYSFAMCNKLSSVTFGKSIEVIGESAFYNCRELKEIKIPEGVKLIGKWAFSKTSLKSVIFSCTDGWYHNAYSDDGEVQISKDVFLDQSASAAALTTVYQSYNLTRNN